MACRDDPGSNHALDRDVAANTRGTMLFSQLDLKDRLDRAKPGYDPVGEPILIQMLRNMP